MHTKESTQQLRSELKAAFPGIKFSVRMHRGSSVNVEWTDGPTEKEVEAISNQYERVSYCEMTNEILSGGNSFVFCKREYSAETYQNAVKAALAKNWAIWSHLSFETLEFNEEGNSLKGNIYTVDRGVPFWFSELVNDQIKDKSFMPTAKPKAQKAQPVQENAIAIAAATELPAVTVTENDERDGVEIRFTYTLSSDELTALDKAGFKWSRFNRCYYAKRTAETLEFAASLELQDEPAPTEVEPEIHREMLAIAPVKVIPAPTTAQPLALAYSGYTVVAEVMTYAPVVFSSPQQELKDKLGALNVDELSAEQINLLLKAIG